MTSTIQQKITTLALVLAGLAAIIPATPALAAERPVKELLESQIGWNVNQTKILEGAPQPERNLCTVASKDQCQPASESSEPGGFGYLFGIAVESDAASPQYGDVYVADTVNNRVQVLTSSGEFVSMFGKEVNATTKGDICTQEEITKSGVKCTAGETGHEAGALILPKTVAVDPSTGNVYVDEQGSQHSEVANDRVDEYTSTGQFILMFGKEVNETTKGDICTQEEITKTGVKCEAGVNTELGKNEPGAFTAIGEGHPLAVDPTNHLLYVGEEHRVQEFEADGKYKGELSLTGISAEPASYVEALAIDEVGDVYLVYYIDGSSNIIYKFDPAGEEVKENSWPYVAKAKEETGAVSLHALAVDHSGRLATTVFENLGPAFSPPRRSYGLLLSGAAGRLITEFPAGDSQEASGGLAFAPGEVGVTGGFAMYALLHHEVSAYKPVPVGEPSLTGPAVCTPGVEAEADATFDCSLFGSVNPWGVLHTEAWFEWGETPSLGSETAKQAICATVCGEVSVGVSPPGVIEGLRPNVSRYYRLAGRDENVEAPELLTSETASFATPIVAPRVVGVPSVSFVHASSAVLFGELDPENARTEYFFEYGPCPNTAACSASPYPDRTAALQSQSYGTVGSTFEAVGLQPSTVYHYRLLAESENTLKTEKRTSLEGPPAPEGVFESAPAPKVQAETGAVSAVTSTSAVVSGAVDPGGQAAIYTFELGIYNAGETRYGVVFSGPVAAGVVPVGEALQLTGLQPGTTYAYRLEVQSGYGASTGAPVTFTTEGLPAVLAEPTPLAMLAIPNIAFPAAVTSPTTKAAAKKQAKKKGKKTKDRKKAKAKKTSRFHKARK
jgi:hypothetical protein